MFVFFRNQQRVKRVNGGRTVTADCPGCGATATFYECKRSESVKAFALVELWDSTDTVYACGKCGDIFEMAREPDAGPEPDVERDHRTAAERTRQAAYKRKVAEKMAHKRARDAAERERQRKAATARRERQIDDELAALKRKLGRD